MQTFQVKVYNKGKYVFKIEKPSTIGLCLLLEGEIVVKLKNGIGNSTGYYFTLTPGSYFGD